VIILAYFILFIIAVIIGNLIYDSFRHKIKKWGRDFFTDHDVEDTYFRYPDEVDPRPVDSEENKF
jgi:hypothetical protein